MNNELIGNRIMLARKEAGLMQRQLGNKLHLNQATISCYEKGLLAIDIQTIQKISAVLGKPIAYFFGDEYSKNPSLISLDEVSIPIFTEIPIHFPNYDPADVKGFQKQPRHMFPGADLILKNPINLAQEPDDAGNYYYLKIETKPQYGKPMLIRIDSKFYLQRVTTKKNFVEVHSIKSGAHSIHPENIEYLAQLIYLATYIT